jgi:hypothetical protein
MYLAGSSVRRVEASSKPGWLGSVCHQLLRGKQSGGRRSASTLSKALWKGTAVDTIWRHTELVGAQLRLGTRIVALDRASKMVVDAAGNAFGYDRLLLATGFSSAPIRSSPAGASTGRAAARHAIPTLYEVREFVEAGGLMSYGTVLSDGYWKGADTVTLYRTGRRGATGASPLATQARTGRKSCSIARSHPRTSGGRHVDHPPHSHQD